MSKINYEGQVVIVTGAGGGLGSVYSREIARRGGAVLVNDLGDAINGLGDETSPVFADTVVAAIHAEGGKAVANYDTVASVAGARRIVEAAMDHFGRIDAVIANAGILRHGPFESLSFEDLNALFAVHVGGSWNVTQAAWPEMKRRGYGRVVLVSSSTAMFGNAMLAAYAAAKGAVMGLTHCLAEAGKPHGILCNAIMPNALTRMTSTLEPNAIGENPWAAALGKYFDPEYTTGLVTFLASSACMTHHEIYSACGGRIGRTFIGVTNGIADDVYIDADTVAANWNQIRDDTRGYTIPMEVADEFRIVAGQRGVKV